VDREGLRGRSYYVLRNSPGPASLSDMDLFSDPQQPPASPEKPKITAEERRARDADRLATIRLRMLISRALEEQGIITPAAIAGAVGMPPAEANKLMTGRRWRAGDVALLEAAAARLGLQTPS
jgi:hypothetical protein